MVAAGNCCASYKWDQWPVIFVGCQPIALLAPFEKGNSMHRLYNVMVDMCLYGVYSYTHIPYRVGC